MCRYLKNRSSILAVMRLLLLAFAAFVVPSIVQGPPASATKWMDMSGIGPLVVIPLGLMVSSLWHLDQVLVDMLAQTKWSTLVTYQAMLLLRNAM